MLLSPFRIKLQAEPLEQAALLEQAGAPEQAEPLAQAALEE